MKPELISFDTCPFVQRSVITLLEKGVEFDITYIDLADKPDWFLKISPFGKVPVLRQGNTVLFESAVINEYLDEVNPPMLLPSDPLRKAHNRAWIEFSSNLLMNLFQWAMTKDEQMFKDTETLIIENAKKIEDQLGDGPFFNGSEFSLVDAAYAPFFVRADYLKKASGQNLLSTPKVEAWSAALLSRESVQNSAPKDLAERSVERIKATESILGQSF